MNRLKVVLLSVILATLLTYASDAHAQCTDYTPQTYTCRSVGCFGSYEPPPPGGGSLYDDSGLWFVCCGRRVLVYSGGGGCLSASLRNVDAKRSLGILVAEGTELMVRDCQGHFQRYRPAENKGSQVPRDLLKEFEELHISWATTPKG